MGIKTKSAGVALAIAAAALTGCASSTEKPPSTASNVHCYGVNQCKGHNDCKTATNACKGLAACKGMGFVALPATTCEKVGGKVSS